MTVLNGEVKVYLRLSGEIKDRFLRIKEDKGLKNDTEVLRLIITEYYKKFFASDEKGLKEAVEA